MALSFAFTCSSRLVFCCLPVLKLLIQDDHASCSLSVVSKFARITAEKEVPAKLKRPPKTQPTNQTKAQDFEILMMFAIMAVVELVQSLQRSFRSLPVPRSGPCRPLRKPESWLHTLALIMVYVYFICIHVPVCLGIASATGYCFCYRVRCVAMQ